VPEQSQTTRAAAGACDEIVKRLDQTGLGMIEPPSRQRRGATGGRAAGHQNRLDDTLKKSGSSLAVVGYFVDQLLGPAGGAVPVVTFEANRPRLP